MYCEECGAKNTDDSRFCTECGKPMTSSSKTAYVPGAQSTHSSDNEAAYLDAVIGPKNTQYYLSKFQKFASSGSRISWNWPAFLITFYWLLYRKMWGWAVLYYFIPYLLAAVGAAVAGDVGFYAAYLGLTLVVFPMYANFFYYRNVKKKIQAVTAVSDDYQKNLQAIAVKGGTSNVAVVIIAILAAIAMLGILAAIALPAYQDYTIRAKVSEPLVTLAQHKTDVAEYYSKNGEWPRSLADYPTTSFVANAFIDRNGAISVTLTGIEQLEGKTLTLKPTVGTGKTIVWACESPDIDQKYLPANCRK